MKYQIFNRSADGSSAFERESAGSEPLHTGCVIEGGRFTTSLRSLWRTSRSRSGLWRTSRSRSGCFIFLLIFSACLHIACESPTLKANKTAVNKPENKAADFESDLQTMKTAKFEHIFVFRRTDGGVFDSEDKAYLKANSPAATNRFILSDNDKAVIAGSGFEFPPENLKALRERFNVEDFSPPKEEPKKDK